MAKRNLRILFLTEYYPPAVHGGGEISCSLLAKHLVKAGVQVVVLTSSVAGLPQQRNEEGVEVLRMLTTGSAPGSMVSNFRRAIYFRRSLIRTARQLLKSQQFDAVHCFNMTTIPAIELRKEFSVPFIAHVNSLLFACPKGDLLYHEKSLCTIHCDYTTFVPCLRDCKEVGKMKNSLLISYNPFALSTMYARYFNLKRLLPEFDHIVAISNFLKQRLVFVGVPEEKISVVHNIVDLSEFFPKHFENKTPQLLFVGSLSIAKGIPELLEALRQLPGNWQCNIYGDGPSRAAVEAAAKEDARVKFNPVIPTALPRLYQQADIVLFPSHWPEPLGRIALEAMASGKPVVTTATGGIVDTVTQDTGILVPPGNAQRLHEAIVMLLADPKKRHALGQGGRKHISTHFTPKALTAQMLGIYEKVRHE